MRDLTIRNMAQLIATADGRTDPASIKALHERFRSWSAKGILGGSRLGGGKTLPIVFKEKDLCRVRILTVLHGIGSDGSDLQAADNFAETTTAIEAYDRTISLVTGDQRHNLQEAIAGVKVGTPWTFTVLQACDTDIGCDLRLFYITPSSLAPTIGPAGDIKADHQVPLPDCIKVASVTHIPLLPLFSPLFQLLDAD